MCVPSERAWKEWEQESTQPREWNIGPHGRFYVILGFSLEKCFSQRSQKTNQLTVKSFGVESAAMSVVCVRVMISLSWRIKDSFFSNVVQSKFFVLIQNEIKAPLGADFKLTMMSSQCWWITSSFILYCCKISLTLVIKIASLVENWGADRWCLKV